MSNIEIIRDFFRKFRIKSVRFIADNNNSGFFETITYDNFYYQNPTEFAPFQINMDDYNHFEIYIPEDKTKNWKIFVSFNHSSILSTDEWLAYKFSIFEYYK